MKRPAGGDLPWLFVYDEFLRGRTEDGLLARLTRNPARMHGHLFRMPAGNPAFVADPAGPPVSGEVLALDDLSLLTILDVMRGTAGGPFSRQVHPVIGRCPTRRAQVYAVSAEFARVARLRPLQALDWRTIAPG